MFLYNACVPNNLIAGVEIDLDGSGKACKLTKADFNTLSKQLNADKNADIRQALIETNGLPNYDVVAAMSESNDDASLSRRDRAMLSIQLLSRSTANALRKLFSQKEKQAAW